MTRTRDGKNRNDVKSLLEGKKKLVTYDQSPFYTLSTLVHNKVSGSKSYDRDPETSTKTWGENRKNT
jgi:hypothetical protein